MKTPRSQIAPVIAAMTLRKDVDAEKLGRDIAAYLLDEGRTAELESLLRDVIACRADQGIIEVMAVSAHELTDAARRDIEQLVRDNFPSVQRIIVDHRLDSSVVGGLRLELVDRQLDTTVRDKLDRFKELTAVERA